MTVSCAGCGQTWPRDPSLEVACPSCHAPVGRWCQRPSGHRAASLHAERERLAIAEGFLQLCSAGPTLSARRAQPELFASPC